MKNDLEKIKKNGMKFGENFYLFKEGKKYFLYKISEDRSIEIIEDVDRPSFKEECEQLDKILRKRKLRKLLS